MLVTVFLRWIISGTSHPLTLPIASTQKYSFLRISFFLPRVYKIANEVLKLFILFISESTTTQWRQLPAFTLQVWKGGNKTISFWRHETQGLRISRQIAGEICKNTHQITCLTEINNTHQELLIHCWGKEQEKSSCPEEKRGSDGKAKRLHCPSSFFKLFFFLFIFFIS